MQGVSQESISRVQSSSNWEFASWFDDGHTHQRLFKSQSGRTVYENLPNSRRKQKHLAEDLAAVKLINKVLKRSKKGIAVHDFGLPKGRGVIATQSFHPGDFLTVYEGNEVTQEKAEELELQYANENKGCYILYFEHKNKKLAIDATEDDGSFGRLVNHKRSSPNARMVTIDIFEDRIPYIKAISHISPGDEICYDYGDTSWSVMANNPWLDEQGICCVNLVVYSGSDMGWGDTRQYFPPHRLAHNDISLPMCPQHQLRHPDPYQSASEF